MKYSKLLVLIALTAAFVSFAVTGSSASDEYATRSSQGEISFQLTPQAPANGHFTVRVRADTHSGNLADVDLSRVMTLHAGEKTYRPVSAEPLSGHHAAASVTFDLERLPDRFTITISGIRDMGELKFEWP